IPVTTRGHATLACALMRAASTRVLVRTLVANTAAQGTTAAHRSTALTLIMVARAIITEAELTRITATTRAGPTPIGVTERPGGITLTRIRAVTHTVVTTTTTRTTRQRTAIMRHWSPPCSGSLANSVIIMA